jgi:hypothetical protein
MFMAVVQQLVRLTLDELEACRISEDALYQVIWHELRQPDDYLDIDWSPSGIEVYLEKSGQLPEVQNAFKLATEGARIVNEACTYPESDRDMVNHYAVYSHITELSPFEVQLVTEAFHRIDMDSFLSWLPEDIDEAREVLGRDAGAVPENWHPNQYFGKFLTDLIEFYETAAAQEWATIMWWD